MNNFFASPYSAWGPIAALAALFIILVLAMVYILGPIFGRDNIRAWVKIKIYDTLFALALILIFSAFSTSLCTFNPVQSYTNAGLLTPSLMSYCPSSNGVPMVDSLYSIALCDIYSFNSMSFNLISNTMFGYMLTIAYIPTVKLNIGIVKGLGVVIEENITGDVLNSFSFAVKFIYSMMIFNQLQLLLLSIAPLVFGLFMGIGLLARVFGISRSFGGAMIAFAIGLGFVYPLMISLTYGFVSTTLANIFPSVLQFSGAVTKSTIINDLFVPATATTDLYAVLTVSPLFMRVVEAIGLMSIGSIFIPVLNVVIVDTFIIDFSKAVGEQMDFLSLISRLM
jgi:hypothetical protein